MMKGIVGRFFFQFGVTVSVAVLLSMFVSFTLTPMLSSRLLRVKRGRPGRSRARSSAASGSWSGGTGGCSAPRSAAAR
jgi:HAE1 family hydrophobic/amphiphilic exporter-1